MTQTAPPSAEAPPTGRPAVRPGAIVAVGSMCGIVVALTQTMIVPLVPVLPTILHSSAADASWAITATLLTAAVATPIFGRLGDMYGKRLMLLTSLAALLAGSVVCAVSSSLALVVLGRGLQGLSMGCIALGISIMRDELPADRIGPAVARMSATMGVGGAIGLPLAAIIAEKGNWHVLFWVSAGLAAICLVAVVVVVPESPVKTPARFDFLGAVGLTAGLVMLLLVITDGADWGWGSRLSLGLLAGSLAVLVLWGAWELRATAPLVDLRVSARRQVLLTNIASVAVGFGMYGMSLVPIQLLMAPPETGYGMGLTMIRAGLVIAPSGLMMYLCSGIGARISRARGSRASLLTGIVVVAAGYAVLLVLREEWWQVLVASALSGAGIGIAYAAMPALIMGAVPITETAAANGLNSLMRSMGTSLSSAAVSGVLAHQTIALGSGTLPSAHGFTVALLVCVVACAVGFVFALGLPRRPRSSGLSAPG